MCIVTEVRHALCPLNPQTRRLDVRCDVRAAWRGGGFSDQRRRGARRREQPLPHTLQSFVSQPVSRRLGITAGQCKAVRNTIMRERTACRTCEKGVL